MSAPTACAYAITDASAVETVQISSHSPNGSMFVKALTQSYCRCRNHIIFGIASVGRSSSHWSSFENMSRGDKSFGPPEKQKSNFSLQFWSECIFAAQESLERLSNAIMVWVHDGRNPGSFRPETPDNPGMNRNEKTPQMCMPSGWDRWMQWCQEKIQWPNPNGVYHGVYCYFHGRPFHGHVWMIRSLLWYL